MPSVIRRVVLNISHRMSVSSMGELKWSGSTRVWARISRKVSPGAGTKLRGRGEPLPSTFQARSPRYTLRPRSPKDESILPANTCRPGPAGCKAHSRPGCEPHEKFPTAAEATKRHKIYKMIASCESCAFLWLSLFVANACVHKERRPHLAGRPAQRWSRHRA